MVLVPHEAPRLRGIHATGAMSASRRTVNFTQKELQEITDAAQACGVSVSAFVRSASSRVAQGVLAGSQQETKHD